MKKLTEMGLLAISASVVLGVVPMFLGITFGYHLSVVVGLIWFVCSGLVHLFFNTEQNTRLVVSIIYSFAYAVVTGLLLAIVSGAWWAFLVCGVVFACLQAAALYEYNPE